MPKKSSMPTGPVYSYYGGKVYPMTYVPDPKQRFHYAAMRIHDNGFSGYVLDGDKLFRITRFKKTAEIVREGEERERVVGEIHKAMELYAMNEGKVENPLSAGGAAFLAVGAVIGVAAIAALALNGTNTKQPVPAPSPAPPLATTSLIRKGTRWWLFGDETADGNGLGLPLNVKSQALGASLTNKSVPKTTVSDWANSTPAVNAPTYDVMVGSLGTWDIANGVSPLADFVKLKARVAARNARFLLLLPPTKGQDPNYDAFVQNATAAGIATLKAPPIATGGTPPFPDVAGYQAWANSVWNAVTATGNIT